MYQLIVKRIDQLTKIKLNSWFASALWILAYTSIAITNNCTMSRQTILQIVCFCNYCHPNILIENKLKQSYRDNVNDSNIQVRMRVDKYRNLWFDIEPWLHKKMSGRQPVSRSITFIKQVFLGYTSVTNLQARTPIWCWFYI